MFSVIDQFAYYLCLIALRFCICQWLNTYEY